MRYIRQLLFVTTLSFCINSLHAQQFPSAGKNAKISYKIIPAAKHTWGYDIYNGTKLFVHQPTIPALPGNKGFDTKQAAEKVAKKVIEKIQKGEMPPSITIDEMKQMDVIKK
jgi:hypothetical protein